MTTTEIRKPEPMPCQWCGMKLTERDVLLLRWRDAIADKEWSVACANMETARAGKWTCDWYADIVQTDRKIAEITKELASIAGQEGNDAEA